MRACPLVFNAFIAMLVFMPTPADARYCLRRAGSLGHGRCDFTTRQASMRIASASRATCGPSSSTFHHSPSRLR